MWRSAGRCRPTLLLPAPRVSRTSGDFHLLETVRVAVEHNDAGHAVAAEEIARNQGRLSGVEIMDEGDGRVSGDLLVALVSGLEGKQLVHGHRSFGALMTTFQSGLSHRAL